MLKTKNTHYEKIMTMVVQLMDNLALQLDEVDYIAVARGPGSFTGLRIGMATTKALAHGAKKDVIAITSLEALAYNLSHYHGLICPILNAKKH